MARIRADSKPIPPCRSGRVCLRRITNQLLRTSAISQHPTVLRYQIHIEHHDCSVNDDITISFYLFDTAKIVYTSSADHRPLHPESDSFCSFFNFTTATFPGAHNQPIRLLLRAQARSCVFLISFFFSLCVGVTVLGTNCFFFFVYNCMLWAILCFASTTFLPGIASPTSDLYLVIRWTLRDTPIWDTASPHESCHHDALTVVRFPLTGAAPGPHKVACSTSHATRKPNRMDPILPSGRSHKPRPGMNVHQRWGLLFGGMWGSLRSDTLCYFVAPRLPVQFLGDNWEDTPHTVTYTQPSHTMHTRAHTQPITRKQQTHEMGTRIEPE